MIECSERFLSQGSVVINGYKEGQDVAGARHTLSAAASTLRFRALMSSSAACPPFLALLGMTGAAAGLLLPVHAARTSAGIGLGM